MAQQEDKLKKIISHAKEYGFIFPSSEIYDGLGAVYDYGHNGVELKNNIKEYWWKSMVYLNENIVGLDSAIFMHPKIWKASGHVDAFNDPLIDNKDSKKRYRADQLIEEFISKIEEKIDKEVIKGKRKFGDNFDLEKYLETNPNVLRHKKKLLEVQSRFIRAMQENDLRELYNIIVDYGISDPETGSKNWTEVRQFNLMFQTQFGSLSEGANNVYLRPETAQGIFVNFLNILKTSRMRLPFGIAQIGKAFRNEIVARQFIFRMREFEQMEMQFFVRPGTEIDWFEYWKEKRLKWHKNMGLGDDLYRIHKHEKLAHYANAAVDIEFAFPMGFKELEGIHSRTDFDLSQHEKYSGKKIQYYDQELKKSYVPFVVETSIGLDRTVLAVLSASYREEDVSEKGQTETRIVLNLPHALAPVKAAIFSLVRKDKLPEIARRIYKILRTHFHVIYEEKDSIGKRYRRQDAIGTPYCITVDFQTLEDNTVTVRDRDTMEQVRVPINKLLAMVEKRVSMTKFLENLEQ